MASLWGLRMRSNRRAASLNILGECPNSRHWQLVASVAQQREAFPKSAICADESSDPLSVVADLTFCGRPLGLRPPAPVPVPPAHPTVMHKAQVGACPILSSKSKSKSKSVSVSVSKRYLVSFRYRYRYRVEPRHKPEMTRFRSRFRFRFRFRCCWG
jgi:hypothetical protein